jgi:hypothetical protein
MRALGSAWRKIRGQRYGGTGVVGDLPGEAGSLVLADKSVGLGEIGKARTRTGRNYESLRYVWFPEIVVEIHQWSAIIPL